MALWLPAVVAVWLLALVVGRPAAAVGYEWGEVKLRLDSFLTTSMSVRTQSRDCRQIGGVVNDLLPALAALTNGGCNFHPSSAVNGVLNGRLLNSDDGNLNVDKGDVYSVLASVGHDLDVKWRNFGAFVRVHYFYDAVQIANFDDWTPRRTDLAKEARWRGNVVEGGVVGVGFRLLDAYAWGTFDAWGRLVEVRFGNQVINWGEEYFTQGGIKATNAFDVTKLRLAGSELKEGLVPAPIVRVSGDLIGDLSLEAYYQFDWHATQIDPTGTFFSVNDMVARGAEGQFTLQDPGQNGIPAEVLLTQGGVAGLPPVLQLVILGGVPRGRTVEADSQGQWGAALRYYWDRIQTEFGLYYVRFHDKLPTVSYVGTGIRLGQMQYYTEYVEKINLYGMSFNTTIAGVAVGGEVSFRPNMPTPTTSAFTNAYTRLNPAQGGQSFARERGMVREKRIMAIINALFVGGPATRGIGPVLRAIGADDMNLIGELAVVNYPDLDGPVAYAPPNGVAPQIDFTPFPGQRALNVWRPDDTSLGYQLRLGVTYSRVFGTAVTLSPSVSFRHDAWGTTPDSGVQFTQGVKKIGLQLTADYQNRWKGIFAYANSFGAGVANTDNDRDFAQFTISYAF